MPLPFRPGSEPRGPLTSRIRQLNDIAHRLQEVEQLLRELPPTILPDVLGQLRFILELYDSPITVVRDVLANEPDEGGGTVADRMKEFFRERQNRSASVPEIAEAAGASPETVRSILYKRNRGRFVKDQTSAGWQLATAIMPGEGTAEERERIDELATRRFLDMTEHIDTIDRE